MRQITKTAAVENATAIWKYDPTLDDNRVLGGSLDVIAAIRTLAIKVWLLCNCIYPFLKILTFHRFKHPDSISSTFKAPRCAAGFLKD